MTGGSAQLENLPLGEDEAAQPVGGLRKEAAERLAAHRQRRVRAGHAEATGELRMTAHGARGKIAAAVKERYAQSPTYRAFLAEEAQRAIRQAAAAAEGAARSAEAVAAVQGELLAELEKWNAPQDFTAESGMVSELPASESTGLDPSAPQVRPAMGLNAETPAREVLAGGITVRLYESLGRPSGETARRTGTALSAEEARELEEEIRFRQAPVFDDVVDFKGAGAIEPLAANLVEFPRQLVAARKARPRLAEGPLRDDAPKSPQLRIFEVEAEQIAREPVGVTPAPEWASMRLGAQSVAEPVPETLEELLPSLLPPRTAPVSRRLMAWSVDLVLVSAGFLAFAVVAAKIAGSMTRGIPLGLAGLGAFAALLAGYLVLFFSFGDQTPGMRYARIGLCTFTDENPSRKAMRRRLLAMGVAAAPLGLGLLWVWMDEDRLGWHDRISRMYQRAY